ncbi:putative fluoride ion transporter CrcB [Clostridium ljungdahlii]|uniref:Fluoride-specific ion channel FluC n=1 Tax=Clostridium ljungdahlii TaxID=1538 RepID=A0A162KLG4_9CLOT|nr:putative fluoride ion transporter CrcB [Clostridium ljungdahlii]
MPMADSPYFNQKVGAFFVVKFTGGIKLKKYIYIGIGGFLGAILRFTLENIKVSTYLTLIPINTLFINITGAFILASVTTAAVYTSVVSSNIKLAICTGFAGAYTTFSTLCKETVSLINSNHLILAICYICISLILGLAFAYLGEFTSIKLVSKLNLNYSVDLNELKNTDYKNKDDSI